MAYVEAFLQMLDPVVSALQSFVTLFDLSRELPSAVDPGDPQPGDKESIIDDQLDKIGSLLGIPRALPTSNPDIPTYLTNELYQLVIRAKILTNQWDGTIEGLQVIMASLYPNLSYEIYDAQDMTYSIIINSPNESAATLALLTEGFMLPKPSGVGVTYQVISTPLFGWDYDTAVIKGWDLANWSRV